MSEIQGLDEVERRRIAALRSFELLDTPFEARFDRVVRVAARIFGSPIALISLVDVERQWFKAAYGLDVRETERSISFCTHAIKQTNVFVVPDAALDDRFAGNPLVTGDPRIRFYAGAPLITSDGDAIGTLCVIDKVPWSEFPDHAQEALRDYAAMVMDWFEADRAVRQLSRENHALRRDLDRVAATISSKP